MVSLELAYLEKQKRSSIKQVLEINEHISKNYKNKTSPTKVPVSTFPLGAWTKKRKKTLCNYVPKY